MTATFNVPPGAVPYNGKYNTIPSDIFLCKEPQEGFKCIPASILWVQDGGPAYAVLFNCNAQGAPGGQISHIKGLYVDNLSCSGSIEIVFPDTLFTFEVPANAAAFVPVSTKGLQFYVLGPTGPINTADQTILMVYNHPVMPAELPSPSTGTVWYSNTFGNLGTFSSTLVTGTLVLTGYELSLGNYICSADDMIMTFALQSITSSVNLWQTTRRDNSGELFNGILTSRSGLGLVVAGGVQLVCTAGGTGIIKRGTLSVNFEYWVP